MASVDIIPFKPELARYFKELNLAWLKKYFTVEPVDEEMLSRPGQYIIEKGGYIFFTALEGKIAGTFALLKHDEQVFELSKMAVDEAFQGKNIGNELMGFCLKEADRLHIKKLILYSSTRLKPAIHLYIKYRFKEVPLGNSAYVRSDIKMEKIIHSE